MSAEEEATTEPDGPTLGSVLAAFIFLTQIPLARWPFLPEPTRRDWRWAPAHFPLVGCVLGLLLAPVPFILAPLGSLAAAGLTIALSMLLTGAFHEDGLADTFDAMGGAFEPGRVLEILKDSRIGTFGGAALGISILCRTALLAEVGRSGGVWLPLVFCVARCGPVWQLARIDYVSPPQGAKSRDLASASPWVPWLATTWVALVVVGYASTCSLTLNGVLFLAVLQWSVWLVTARWYRRRVGGITGDFLGATEQLSELVALGWVAWGTTVV